MVNVQHIIDQLTNIEVDGETMEHIIRQVGMEDQMLRQLIMKAPISIVQDLVEEKALNSFDADDEAQEWEVFRERKI